MMLVINLFAGPSSGKSTTAAATFAKLKYAGINCELVTEFAKDKVWEKSLAVLENQPYLLGKQFHRLFRLRNDVDVAITDSPLLLASEYGKAWGPAFHQYVLELHNFFTSINYFVVREKPYNSAGRVQTEEEAMALDTAFDVMLESLDIDFKKIAGNESAAGIIVKDVLEILNARD